MSESVTNIGGGGNCQPLPCSYGHECNSYELGDISSNLPRLVT